MKKAENSLKRLNKGKKPTFSLFGSSDAGKDNHGRDEELIRAQMMLDVKAFGKDAQSLGVVIEESEGFKALHEMAHAPIVDDS
jgi:hypothetical protein